MRGHKKGRGVYLDFSCTGAETCTLHTAPSQESATRRDLHSLPSLKPAIRTLQGMGVMMAAIVLKILETCGDVWYQAVVPVA